MSRLKIEFNVLDRQYRMYADEYKQAAIRVLESGQYILGQEVENFELKYAKYTGSKYCVGVNSGLDALVLAFRALGINKGDEVIVPANTYIASVLAITENGAIPIFVEPDEYHNLDDRKIEDAITNRTKAILVVHLYGQAANIRKIKEIVDKYNLFLVEDCAQSHGSKFDGQLTGTFGDIGCFSFFPTKNLGAFGDSGAIITDNQAIADLVRMLRNYGSKVKYQYEIEGVNSRLDELQAALLSSKLSHLSELTQDRVRIAMRYLKEIKNTRINMPITRDMVDHVYHLFVVQCKERDDFQKYLLECGIKTQIHYPIPPHLAECYRRLGFGMGDFPITEKYANEVISLPLYNGMTDEEIDYVVEAVNKWSK
ncbi:MAG: aminotransferase [Gracilibacter sp. BRH_c7a]|nr:MAG: aminotransferase [Gracilibacter sp. BRH_c7a]